MKKKTIRRNTLKVLAVLVMLMAMLLTACSSSKTDAAPASEETSAAEADKEAELAEQAKEEAAEPEPTAEPTPEPTPEAVVYEGIDMESTLPGKEWVETFEGVIEEPLLVVFNDETNKKAIIEDGEEVKYEEGDTFGVFIPKTTMLVDCSCFYVDSVNYFDHVGCYNEIVLEDNIIEKLKEENHKVTETDMEVIVTDMSTGERSLELTITLRIETDL